MTKRQEHLIIGLMCIAGFFVFIMKVKADASERFTRVMPTASAAHVSLPLPQAAVQKPVLQKKIRMTVPKVKQGRYLTVHKAWKQAINHYNLSGRDMPYKTGTLAKVTKLNGKVKSHVGTWYHSWDRCQLQVTFSKKWKIKGRRMQCH